MQPFKIVTGLVVPLNRANVDTDAIIPKQFLKSVKKTGFGNNLFDEWRYLDPGEPDQDCSNRPINKDFVLNQARYKGGRILLAKRNFGCGSSREHAVWALGDYGIRVVIAPSFADIFFNNCFKNGVLPICLEEGRVDQLFSATEANEGYILKVDLESQVVELPGGEKISFKVDEFRKHCLLNGLDDIALTLAKIDDIRDFETKWKSESPWLFGP